MSPLTVWLTALELVVLEECVLHCEDPSSLPQWGTAKRAAYTRMVAKVLSAIARARGDA